ncbi:MAG: hypothetical protein R3293_19560 [Candidatus Promineifilaceae bacterium]|nr:hypothetical protein [Candidatus Promineifilaceae bacterium]
MRFVTILAGSKLGCLLNRPAGMPALRKVEWMSELLILGSNTEPAGRDAGGTRGEMDE